MVDTDKPAFLQAIARLAVALRENEPDVVQMRTYFAALHDLEIEFIVAAADRLIGQSQWFPKTSEWRAMAAKVEAERRVAQHDLLRKLPVPLCPECSDTGWTEDPSAGRVQNLVRRNKESGGMEVVSIPASPPRKRCGCQQLRRLELLGRRPWPGLPEASSADQTEQPLEPGEAVSLMRVLEQQTGRRIGIRVMSEPISSRRRHSAGRRIDIEADQS